jgi:hypothetical protein
MVASGPAHGRRRSGGGGPLVRCSMSGCSVVPCHGDSVGRRFVIAKGYGHPLLGRRRPAKTTEAMMAYPCLKLASSSVPSVLESSRPAWFSPFSFESLPSVLESSSCVWFWCFLSICFFFYPSINILFFVCSFGTDAWAIYVGPVG